MNHIIRGTAALVLIALLAGCAGSQAFQRGEKYAKNNEWDLAVKEYREALKKDPHDIQYRSALIRAEETAANQHYKKARSLVKERKLDQAITELQQAIYLNPQNAAIQSALKTVLDMKQGEEHYRASLTYQELNRLNEAIAELTQSVELDPENGKYRDALDKLQKKKIEIEPDEALSLVSDKPITLNFKNTNIKDVFEFLSKLSGINILFDEEVKAQPVTVFVKDVSFQYALNLLLSTNKLFMKKISADTIIIIPKSKAKTDQYQDLMVKTYYINIAKAKDMVNVIRTMIDVKKVYVNEVLNSLTIRETPEKLKLIEKIIAANDLKEAEVILDVEILEISRTNTLSYGWNFVPGLSAAASLQQSGSTSPSSLTLNDLSHLSNKNVFVTMPSLVVNLLKQDSDAQTLANPRVRVLNNKQAKFLIGQRIPVQTSAVQSTATGAVTSQFDYKDVGINVTVEPTVHLNSTITMKLNLEISSLGDLVDFGSGGKQYKFGTRKTDTFVNLRDGEAVIIGGLIQDEERKSMNKIPMLGDLPILGKLFSNTDTGAIKTDILMSITPNIVRTMELPDKDSQIFWSGTEENYDTKPLFVTTAGKSSKPSEKQIDKTAVLDAMAKRENAVGAAAPEAPKPGPATAPTVTAIPVSQPGLLVASSIEIKPSDMQAAIGQDIRFEVILNSVKDLYGSILTFSYDPKVIEFKTASEGQLMKQDSQQTSFLFSNNLRAGTVDVYMTRIGDVGGVNGFGGLCTLVFQAKAGGTSDVTIKNSKLTNFNREPIRADVKGAKVTVK